MYWFVLFVATTGFTGFLPTKLTKGRLKWGGLMGALTGLGIQIAVLRSAAHSGFWLSLLGLISLAVGLLYAGLAAELMFERYGARQRHNGEWTTTDYNEINVDEVHGQLLSAIPIAWFSLGLWQFWVLNLLSFALFRLIDCKKVWPVSWAEKRLKGAAGVMLDDTVGGIMTAVLVGLAGLLLSAIWPVADP